MLSLTPRAIWPLLFVSTSFPATLSGATAPVTTRGFDVDTTERNAVVSFYHAVYMASQGYRDRIGVYELLRITPEVRRLIVGWATTEELRRLAVAQGMRTMLREAMQMVDDDVTTIPEVVRTLFAH